MPRQVSERERRGQQARWQALIALQKCNFLAFRKQKFSKSSNQLYYIPCNGLEKRKHWKGLRSKWRVKSAYNCTAVRGKEVSSFTSYAHPVSSYIRSFCLVRRALLNFPCTEAKGTRRTGRRKRWHGRAVRVLRFPVVASRFAISLRVGLARRRISFLQRTKIRIDRGVEKFNNRSREAARLLSGSAASVTR